MKKKENNNTSKTNLNLNMLLLDPKLRKRALAKNLC